VSKTAHDRIVVALVNGSRAKVAIPPLYAAFEVHRRGTTIPCVDEPVRLETPEVLDPGASFTAPVAVSCHGRGDEGVYDVDAFLVVDDGGRRTQQSIGSLRVEVGTDPALNNRVLR
jgi:hypothetical protein